jgi:hypothetical protein
LSWNLSWKLIYPALGCAKFEESGALIGRHSG